jgi:uncharacterized protein (UPF0335 family)
MIDATALKEYVERAARLMTEQRALGVDLKELCKECDEAGACSKKELRRLARESLMDQEVLGSQIERMDALRHALGLFAGTPLGEAAVQRETAPRRRIRKKPEADFGGSFDEGTEEFGEPAGST